MRQQSKLNAEQVRNLSAPGQYFDGNGLTLRVESSGSKHWVQRVTIHGKRRNLGLGGYPTVSLANARKMAVENLLAIKQGRDPLAEKQQASEEARRPRKATFAEAARQLIELRRPTWSNSKHADQWENTLATYVLPVIGRKQVDEITTSDILTILAPIWNTKCETASRVRQRIEIILDWTVAQGWRTDNPAGKAIIKVLGKQARQEKNHPALHYSQVPEALNRVRQSSSKEVTRLAFEFLVLTAARSKEVRLARWSEVDWEEKIWTIPAEKMKARREHKVPLSRRAVEVLEEARELGGESSDLIFPSNKRGNPLSENTFNNMLSQLEISAVPHGFRSSFKDWCSEQMGEGYEIASEMALAHNVGNATRRAYSRTELLGPRRELMEAWAEFLMNHAQ